MLNSERIITRAVFCLDYNNKLQLPAGLYAFYGHTPLTPLRVTEISTLEEHELKITLKQFIEAIYSAALLEKK